MAEGGILIKLSTWSELRRFPLRQPPGVYSRFYALSPPLDFTWSIMDLV